MIRILGAALVAAVGFGAAASAATLNGTFTVTAVNVTDVSRAESAATLANFNAALFGDFGFNMVDTFKYAGDLDFETNDTANDATTIAQWLGTGTPGGVTDLDVTFGGLQMSKPNIDGPNGGTATTTFFVFTLDTVFPAADFVVRHDDGVAVFDDGVRIGGFEGPNPVQTTDVSNFNGGALSFLYVATNGDPSIFEVSAINVVPVPAALPLLLAGLGGLALMRRRKAA